MLVLTNSQLPTSPITTLHKALLTPANCRYQFTDPEWIDSLVNYIAINCGFGHHIKGALTFLTMMNRLEPSYQRHITFACTGCYQLHPSSSSRHYYPRPITGINLLTPERWIAKANFMHITFAQGYYTIEFKGTRRKWIQVVGSKTKSIPMNQPCRTL